MGDTSGSAAYRLNWDTGAIEHADGRRWFVPRYMQRVYVALDAVRGMPISSERIAEAIWGNDTGSPDAVRVTIQDLRRTCGRGIVETTATAQGARGRLCQRGYIVRL